MSVSDRLPARRRDRDVVRPDVVVLEPARSESRVSPLLRLALNIAPDVLRAVERSRQRTREQELIAAPPTAARRYTSGLQVSEYEVDVRVPLVRKVTVRRATAWSADVPESGPVTPSRKTRWAGVLGVGSAFVLATLGVLANRAVSRR